MVDVSEGASEIPWGMEVCGERDPAPFPARRAEVVEAEGSAEELVISCLSLGNACY